MTEPECGGYLPAGAVVVVVVDEVVPAGGVLASGVAGAVVVVVVADASGVAGGVAAAGAGVSVVVVSVFFSQPAKAVAASARAASAAIGVFKDIISSPVIGPLSQRSSAKFVPLRTAMNARTVSGSFPLGVVDLAINLV
jgi:hypothetical protein